MTAILAVLNMEVRPVEVTEQAIAPAPEHLLYLALLVVAVVET